MGQSYCLGAQEYWSWPSHTGFQLVLFLILLRLHFTMSFLAFRPIFSLPDLKIRRTLLSMHMLSHFSWITQTWWKGLCLLILIHVQKAGLTGQQRRWDASFSKCTLLAVPEGGCVEHRENSPGRKFVRVQTAVLHAATLQPPWRLSLLLFTWSGRIGLVTHKWETMEYNRKQDSYSAVSFPLG